VRLGRGVDCSSWTNIRGIHKVQCNLQTKHGSASLVFSTCVHRFTYVFFLYVYKVLLHFTRYVIFVHCVPFVVPSVRQLCCIQSLSLSVRTSPNSCSAQGRGKRDTVYFHTMAYTDGYIQCNSLKQYRTVFVKFTE
jgi:hypothetical protein